mmetsp:Transcript_17240/g.56414  ORF Transcript_17240/g.56414 Transcript_17240/m.56414 type:complete len:204 (+) Transcript_17240:151-762(+)
MQCARTGARRGVAGLGRSLPRRAQRAGAAARAQFVLEAPTSAPALAREPFSGPQDLGQISAVYPDAPGSSMEFAADMYNKPESECFGSAGLQLEYSYYNGHCIKRFKAKSTEGTGYKVEQVNGSWIRTDGEILIPGNLADLKTWALDPSMSGDDQVILLAAMSIAAAAGKDYGIPTKVSGVIFSFAKVLATVWVGLYWLQPSF